MDNKSNFCILNRALIYLHILLPNFLFYLFISYVSITVVQIFTVSIYEKINSISHCLL